LVQLVGKAERVTSKNSGVRSQKPESIGLNADS
jgi:hypothetical protein